MARGLPLLTSPGLGRLPATCPAEVGSQLLRSSLPRCLRKRLCPPEAGGAGANGLEALLAEALEPRALYRALVPYAERHQAKAAGFRWNDPVPGAWTRRLSEREVRDLPFAVEMVESQPQPQDQQRTGVRGPSR